MLGGGGADAVAAASREGAVVVGATTTGATGGGTGSGTTAVGVVVFPRSGAFAGLVTSPALAALPVAGVTGGGAAVLAVARDRSAPRLALLSTALESIFAMDGVTESD